MRGAKAPEVIPFVLNDKNESDNISSNGSENIDEYIDNFRNRLELPMGQLDKF
jgi:hypothetical protein